ncbi:MAG: DUF1648 domain-containing protein [Patescibacteria group bacterium]
MKKKWHLAVFIIAILLTIISWVVAVWYWGKLPQTIPTHFGLSGQADSYSQKSIWYTFLIPALQSIMLAFFVFLYKKPQYSDMPTTLLLMAMEEEKREHAFDLIRTMLLMVALFIGILFTYITYGMNASALNNDLGLSPWIMGGVLIAMLVWLVWWTVKVYKTTKNILSKK